MEKILQIFTDFLRMDVQEFLYPTYSHLWTRLINWISYQILYLFWLLELYLGAIFCIIFKCQNTQEGTIHLIFFEKPTTKNQSAMCRSRTRAAISFSINKFASILRLRLPGNLRKLTNSIILALCGYLWNLMLERFKTSLSILEKWLS